MNQKLIMSFFVTLFIVTATFISVIAGENQQSENVSIEGSYILVSRKLPSGKMVSPPDIMGMMTYTKKYRNFNIVIRDENGKFFSVSEVSEYTLTLAEYTDKPLYIITNNEIAGQKINYDLSGKSVSVPVTAEGGIIKFKASDTSPTTMFEGNKVTAEGPDFVDIWEKVE